MPTDVTDAAQSSNTSSLRLLLAEYGPLAVAVGFAILAVAGIALFLVGDESLARSFLDQYGMIALFAILVLEGAMLLYFAPSEALVPASIQLLAASTGDYQTIAALILVAAAGATIGQYALFTLAKRTGRDWLLDRTWFRVSESRLERFEGWFDRWGRAAVPVSNALLFTRGMLTVPAGFAEMRDAEFVVLSALGSIAFQTWLALAWLGVLELGVF
jgi:membrane protein DedA with SNARE-associated domain